MVYEALGYPVPEFAHISMILGADGKKLSKRHGATSVEEYRDAGYDSEAFVNYLALLGWSLDGDTTIVPREVLAREFSLDHVSKNPATFDPAKLDWINSHYLMAKDDMDFARDVIEPQLVAAGLEQPGCVDARPEWFGLLASVLKPRTKKAPEVVDLARFLYAGDTPKIDPKALKKGLLADGCQQSLELARAALEPLDDFDASAIDNALAAAQEATDLKKRTFFGAVRAAATGSLVSPPLGETLELLGKVSVLARIDAALTRIAQESSEA